MRISEQSTDELKERLKELDIELSGYEYFGGHILVDSSYLRTVIEPRNIIFMEIMRREENV